MRYPVAAALALLVSACVPETTASIDIARADSPVRLACPAFRNGPFKADAARTYGSEQITNFQNGSRFSCRCVVKEIGRSPACAQVARYGPVRIEP
jgi:hypothetical protein